MIVLFVNTLYFHDGDVHWYASAQRMAAEVMADYLLGNNLLGRGKATDLHERYNTV